MKIIIITSVVGSVLLSFLSEEKSTKKYMSFAISVVILSIMIKPVFDFVKGITNLSEFLDFSYEEIELGEQDNIYSMLLDNSDSEIKKAISSIAKSKFNIIVDPQCIYISYDATDTENIIIESIKIYEGGVTALKNLNEFCDYISEMLMCECEVTKGIGP